MDFWKNKRVFITGHTGFKGSWLSRILIKAGSEVTGYSLEPPTNPNLFQLASLGKLMNSIIADVRDLDRLNKEMQSAKPDIVIHMAAQPIVRASYENPVYTYETNVMGTVNLLEAVRKCTSVRSLVNVTTDKVYENVEREKGYTEDEKLCGFDPYSNSKSCSDIITYSYKNSFFNNEDSPAISTVRSGNVIGGGDFARDRIIPDCIRAVEENKPIIVRNPNSIRPYQHVLDSLHAYLMIAEKQYEKKEISSSYNVGPDDCDCVTTGTLVDLFCEKWGDGLTWENKSDNGPHESNCLKLDCFKLKNTFGWHPRWNIVDSIDKTVDWAKTYLSKGDVLATMDKQIAEFQK